MLILRLPKDHPDTSYYVFDLKLNFQAISIALPVLMTVVTNSDVGISHIVKYFLVVLLSNRRAF